MTATGHTSNRRPGDPRGDDEVSPLTRHLAGVVDIDENVEEALLQLVASVEPGVVFSSVAAQCVPELCDDCTIDIVDGTHARYRIIYPPRSTAAGGLLRIADRADATADHRVTVPFSHQHRADARDRTHDEARLRDQFNGVATFVWHRRTPTRADRRLATILVGHAVQMVVWQRSEQAAHAAAADAAHLRLALQTSRHIGAAVGILMSLHKITDDQAFELLRLTSQHCHRKLRELALDVINSGWLDPTIHHGPDSPQPPAP